LTQFSANLSSEVRKAKENGTPVIALESTIISHGLPWPENIEIANELEGQIRRSGFCPATIAIIDGNIKVGLEPADLEKLAKTGTKCLKLSSFDIPWALARKETGSTTVAGTMYCAAKADIKIFATGGIGGVHRGFEKTLDISHDLEFMATCPMIVVSAGAKAILDLPATVEYLETKGILTVGWKTDEFPAFYYRESGLKLNCVTENPKDLINTLNAGVKSAIVVANPIPKEFEITKEVIEPVIEKVIAECEENGISGKKLTPALLQAINIETKSKSVACNIEIIRNNVRVACEIAAASVS